MKSKYISSSVVIATAERALAFFFLLFCCAGRRLSRYIVRLILFLFFSFSTPVIYRAMRNCSASDLSACYRISENSGKFHLSRVCVGICVLVGGAERI